MTVHDMTQTKLGRTALHVSGTYLDDPLEGNNGGRECRL